MIAAGHLGGSQHGGGEGAQLAEHRVSAEQEVAAILEIALLDVELYRVAVRLAAVELEADLGRLGELDAAA